MDSTEADEFNNHKTPELINKVGGVWAGSPLQQEFQREVARLLKRNNHNSFPGAQPVSFAKQHIDELKAQDYYVCEKTDGLRVLMYLTFDDIILNRGTPDERPGRNPVTYLIDRRNEYYYVRNLYFPHHENNPNYEKFHVDTLLDGELVEDKLPDGSSTIKFLAFDLLVIDGKDLRERPLDKRLGYLKQFILKPYQSWLREHPQEKPHQAFIVEDKKTEFSYSIPLMFDQIIPQVKQLHGNDGLIFTCKGTKYESGTDKHILKWKPPNENTVDFLMHITWPTFQPDKDDPDQSLQDDYYAFPANIGLYIYHGRNMDYSRIGDLYITPEEWENLKRLNLPLQDSIVECYLEDTNATNGGHFNGDMQPGIKRWRFYRMREDKLEANHVTTFDSVISSIEDHVTEQDLRNHADEIRNAWKSRDARRQSVVR